MTAILRFELYGTPNYKAQMEIPFQTLSEEALSGVIDEFIMREGTDYGTVEASLEKKRRDILEQLKKGKIKLVFDAEGESVTMVVAK